MEILPRPSAHASINLSCARIRSAIRRTVGRGASLNSKLNFLTSDASQRAFLKSPTNGLARVINPSRSSIEPAVRAAAKRRM
jgi:hypothetical protein